MEKIIIREKIMLRGHVNSVDIRLFSRNNYNSIESILQHNNIKDLMKEIFCEKLSSDSLDESSLYQSYKLVHESENSNDEFSFAYRIDDEFAIKLTENIHLYHIIPKDEIVYSSIIPWYYADSKKYIGDTWWENDLEIIENLKELSIIEFLKRYKGY